MLERGGELLVAVTNDSKVFTRICTQNCLTPANWQSGDIDTTAAITAAYNPATYSGAACSGGAALNPTWHMEPSVVALRPDGAVAFAHPFSMLYSCTGSSSIKYNPAFGRLVFLPP